MPSLIRTVSDVQVAGVSRLATTTRSVPAPCYAGGFITYPATGISALGAMNANGVYACQFVLPFQSASNITSGTARLSVAGGSGTAFTAGIYSANGNTKIAEFRFDGNVTGVQTQTAFGGNFQLDPGVYWFAWSCQNTTMRVLGYTVPQTSSDVCQQTLALFTNAMSGGALPASLGAVVSVASVGIPLVVLSD
jgi:hypothetical protein